MIVIGAIWFIILKVIIGPIGEFFRGLSEFVYWNISEDLSYYFYAFSSFVNRSDDIVIGLIWVPTMFVFSIFWAKSSFRNI